MNKGKICISIQAKTAAEFFEKIGRARELVDIVEARFDSLPAPEFEIAVREIGTNPEIVSGKVLATFRPADQGGARQLTREERLKFWNGGIAEIVWGIDLERDIIGDLRYASRPVIICSHHDFTKIPDDIAAIYDALKETRADILKIAASVEDAADALPLWQLLEIAKLEGRSIVPIAMGEAGKWTRILGPAHGAAITYAAFDDHEATAPGQITADDLKSVYRVREIDRDTPIYGLVAGDTSYSLSPYIHNAAFRAANMNNVFVPFQTRELDAFIRRFARPETRGLNLNFRGFAITNPHKRDIIAFLDRIDETAVAIGAVNTVKIENGELFGFNTDARGFIEPLRRALGEIRGARIAVVGTGGAARSCIYALKAQKAIVEVFARDPNKACAAAEEFGIQCVKFENADFGSFDVLVNSTPLGTRGNLRDDTVATAKQIRGVRLVYDLVYNPAETRLLREARLAGSETLGGLDMLIAQAAAQFEIWTGCGAPVDAMRAIAARLLVP